jgi:hypothetical protein
MNIRNAVAAAAAAVATAGALALGVTGMAGAAVHPAAVGPCNAIHPGGFMGSQQAANGMILGVGSGARSPVVSTPVPDFNVGFGLVTNTCFDETHVTGPGNPLLLDWRDATPLSPHQYVTNSGGRLVLSATVVAGSLFIYNPVTQQQVNGGLAISLNPNGTATLVPAAATLAQAPASTQLSFLAATP